MGNWLPLAIYVTGYAITSRIAYAKGDDMADRGLFAICMGLLWPLAAVIAAVVGLLALPTLGAKSKAERRNAEGERRIGALRERQRLDARIAVLEEENERLRQPENSKSSTQ